MQRLERELAEARLVAEKALSDNVLGHHTQELLRKELAEANETLAQATADLHTLATAAALTVEAYDLRYFRAGAWCKAALDTCKTIDSAPAKPEPDTFEAHGHTWTKREAVFPLALKSLGTSTTLFL